MQITPNKRRPQWTQGIESLENRALLSAITIGPSPDAGDTADHAVDLGSSTEVEASGSIGQGGLDVDWYTFTLLVPSTVSISGTTGTYSLYNNASGDAFDALSVLGPRLLAQSTATDIDPSNLTRDLAAGTYYVAVSGAGNLYFHPLLAGSGIAGETGDYAFDFVTSPLDTSTSVEPLVLAVDASPLGAWIDLSGELDFSPLVQITNTAGLSFPVATVHQALNGTELQVVPTAPLPPGTYVAVIRDSLGEIRMSVDFTVPAEFASETGNLGNDTASTAIDLGNLEDLGLVQISGIIGDDTYYTFSKANAALFAGNDVDLYHFHIESNVAVGLQIDLFAGRIGSTLDAGMTLYRLDPQSGLLVVVAGNNNSYNQVPASDGSMPLFHDPVLVAGIKKGEYFLAVSEGYNTKSILENQNAGPGSGIYDVSQAHSGAIGLTMGRYILNMSVSPLGEAPHVTDASIDNLEVLTHAPAEFTVQFDQYMNLTGPAFAAFQQYSQSSVPGIYISDAQGHKYFPRLQAFDATDFKAHFTMADRLPAGVYQLRLSGSLGVTNLAGNPLVGNGPSGDFVVRFVVLPNPVGTNGNPLVWTHDPLTDLIPGAQQLGILFPQELRTGVAFVRPANIGLNLLSDTADEYRFQVTQNRIYHLHLSGVALPAGVSLTLFDHAGNAVMAYSPDNGQSLTARLVAGEYTLRVGSWPTSAARRLNYRVDFNLLTNADDPPALSSGPGATVGLRLVGLAGSGTGGVTPPANSGGTGTGGTSNGSGSAGGGSTGSTGGGTSSSDAGPSIRPGYLSIGNGLSLSNLAVGADGFVIAIPTETSIYTSRASLLRATRTVRGAGLKDQLSLSGLSDLSDGPVGKGNGRTNSNLTAKSHISRLGDLVRSSLSNKPNGIAEKPEVASDSPAPHKPTDAQDTVDAAAEPGDVTAEQSPAPSDSKQSRVAPKTTLDTDLILDAGRQPLPLATSGVASLNGEVKSQRSTDKVFAAGLALLLSELFLPRETNSPPIRRVGESVSRGARRPAHHKAQFQEDSVS